MKKVLKMLNIVMHTMTCFNIKFCTWKIPDLSSIVLNKLIVNDSILLICYNSKNEVDDLHITFFIHITIFSCLNFIKKSYLLALHSSH